MRRLGLNVKRLAWLLAIWHRPGGNDSAQKGSSNGERRQGQGAD